jgi:hypothetical protein
MPLFIRIQKRSLGSCGFGEDNTHLNKTAWEISICFIALCSIEFIIHLCVDFWLFVCFYVCLHAFYKPNGYSDFPISMKIFKFQRLFSTYSQYTRRVLPAFEPVGWNPTARNARAGTTRQNTRDGRRPVGIRAHFGAMAPCAVIPFEISVVTDNLFPKFELANVKARQHFEI